MTDRSAIDTCKRFFSLTDADEEAIAGDAGRILLWQMWRELGGNLYENPLNILRQEWWHTYEAPGRFDAPTGFWLTLPDNALLLDYGCGTAEIDRRSWIEKNRRTILIDRSKTVLSYLRHKYRAQREAGLVETYGDDPNDVYQAGGHEFDAIVCTDLFEHVQHPTRLLKELWKTLKPGGSFLTNFSCSYPHAGHLRASIEQQPTWWRFITENSKIITEDGYIWLIKK